MSANFTDQQTKNYGLLTTDYRLKSRIDSKTPKLLQELRRFISTSIACKFQIPKNKFQFAIKSIWNLVLGIWNFR